LFRVNIYKNEFKSEAIEDYTFIDIISPDQLIRSEIRGNTFTAVSISSANNASIGISLGGNNNHLNIVCNTFDHCKPDIKIISGGQIDDIPNMVLYPNGNSTVDAMNVYTHQSGGSSTNLNIWNAGTAITNVYFKELPMGTYSNFKKLGNVFNPISGEPGQPSNCAYGVNPPCNPSNIQPDQVSCIITSCTELKQESSGGSNTSIQQLQVGGLAFYPNPSASGIFNINKTDLGANQDIEIIGVFDMVGRTTKYDYNADNASLTLPNKGINFVQFRVNSQVFAVKLLVQ